MQTRELEEYCQRKGWQLHDIYVDNGFSGNLGICYSQREQRFGIPARPEHGLKAGKRRTAQQRRCVEHRALHPFHPPLKALECRFPCR